MTKSGNKMNPMGSDLENFSYSLGSSGVEKNVIPAFQNVIPA